MVLDPNKNNLEQQKFRGDSPDEVCVAVCSVTGGPIETTIKAPTGPFKITVASVGTSDADPLGTALTGRVSLSVRNKDDTLTVYFGNTGVTADDAASGGWEIGPGEDFNIDLDASESFFLITTSGTATVKIMEIAST